MTLTPGICGGIAASPDLIAGAIVDAETVTSNWTFPSKDNRKKFHIAGMLGRTHVKGFDVGDYGTDYSVTNNVIRYGISYERDFKTWPDKESLPSWLGGWFSRFHPPSWRIGLANTRIGGDDVFIDNYWDLSVSWGSTSSKRANKKIRLGLSLTKGNHGYFGGRLNWSLTY